MTDAAAIAPPHDFRAHANGLLLVFLGGLLYASAGVFTRALPFDAWTLLAWRSLSGGLFTAGVLAVETGRLSWRDYAMSPLHWLMVPCGAMATIFYIFALKITTVADVMIVYATTPFVTAGVAWLWNHEPPGRRTLVASSVALLGVVVMIGGAAASEARLIGAALVLVMNLAFALLLVMTRRYPAQSMTPVNALSLLLASAVSFVLAPATVIGAGALAAMLLFGIVTVGLAMNLILAGARRAPSAEVALVGISDVVLGPVMVFLVYGENPGSAAIVGGVVVVAALVWNVWPQVRRLF